ncbi:chromate transporter [Paenibacillus sp. HJGM_3]|uniref:chromate transporter n=1 Tax=Paenibacillus sp. HJGM_3 TaxID=3379816 RepID=UPI0038588A7B
MNIGHLVELFLTFVKIGFVSFGGGYSMMPVIEHEVVARNWMNAREFSDMIAISGMSPGPIAANSAVIVGYHTAGVLGAIVAALGIVMPSLLLVVIVGLVIARYRSQAWMDLAFSGLRPIVAAFIFYAAVRFALGSGAIQRVDIHLVGFLVIFAGAFIALLKYKTHPLIVILLSGLVGVALYV